MTQQWPVSLYAAEEEDQMAKCACAAPPPTAHPHQNKTLAKKKEKKKLQPTRLRPHQWTQRAENDRRGPKQRCSETSALSPLLC